MRRVVFASSSSVYGDNPELPKNEKMIPKPLSPYDVSKLTCEHYLRVFNELYDIETISLRYFNVFGPKQDPNSQYSAVIPKFIQSILNDRNPIIYGDGKQSRDFTFVRNVVDANIAAAAKPCTTPTVMNCATHGSISILQLIENINAILGKDLKPQFTDPRPGDVKHSFADIELIKNNLQYIPSIGFREGLEKTINYFESINDE